MFEDRTYDNIMSEMLAGLPDDVNKTESGLIYNSLARQALKIEEMYADMSRLYDNICPYSMDEATFVQYANDRGIYRKEATKAILKGEFSQVIEIGTRFTLNELDYIVTELISSTNYTYKLQCETAGTVGNSTFGAIEPIDYIDDWQGGSITSVFISGEDTEQLDALKERYRETYDIKPFAGNKKAYRDMALSIDNVGDCIPCRITDGTTKISIYVVNKQFKAFLATEVSEIQEIFDPVSSSGDGEGLAPIGHKVEVKTPEENTINVSATVSLETGYTWNGVKESITDKINDYFLTLRKLWQKNNGSTVRVSQVEFAILSIDGVIDCTNVKLNNSTSNITLNYTKVPVLGTLSEVTE